MCVDLRRRPRYPLFPRAPALAEEMRMPTSRRSRRAVLWGAGLYLLLQVGGGIALEGLVPLYRFPSARDALDALASQPTPPRLVVLGSSRFGCGFDQAEANRLLWAATGSTDLRTFNLSVPAG